MLQERKKEAEEKLQSRSKLLVGIREGLDHLVETLVSQHFFFLEPLGCRRFLCIRKIKKKRRPLVTAMVGNCKS
jgi:hypothetical protein